MALDCQSTDGALKTGVVLDFVNERLIFDPFDSVDVVDDGSAKAAEIIRDVLRFQLAYFNNGSLELRETEGGRLMGRCRPFLPVNVNPRAINHRFNQQIDAWSKTIERRRTTPIPPQPPSETC